MHHTNTPYPYISAPHFEPVAEPQDRTWIRVGARAILSRRCVPELEELIALRWKVYMTIRVSTQANLYVMSSTLMSLF